MDCFRRDRSAFPGPSDDLITENWGVGGKKRGERRRERKRGEEQQQPQQLEMCGRAEIAAVGTAEQSLRLVVFQRIFVRTRRQKKKRGGGGDRARIAAATWAFLSQDSSFWPSEMLAYAGPVSTP